MRLDVASTQTFLCSSQCYARGGRPRDEVGTLNVLAHPTWEILAIFEHNVGPGIGKFEECKMKANRVLLCRDLGYECSVILKVPKIPRSSNFPVAIKWRNERNLTNYCAFFNIYVFVNNYFVSVSKSYRIFMQLLFMLLFCFLCDCWLIKCSS